MIDNKQINVPINYEAYLYKITVKSTGKIYIGWHKGKVDGTYWHSCECSIFAEDFAKNDNVYEILDYGNCYEMATKEHIMLKEVDAKNNDDYYNTSNGGGKYCRKTKYENVIELWQDIMNKKLSMVMIDKKIVAAFKKFQVRVANTDNDHVKTLEDSMMEKHGDLTEWEPVHVLKDFYGKGKHCLINGNHTTIAANNIKHVLKMPIMWIEKEIWSQFEILDLETLAILLNPQPEKAAKQSDKEDWIQILVKKYNEKKIPIDSDENKKLMTVNGLKTRKINTIIKKANAEIKNAKMIPPGFQLKKYSDKELLAITDMATDKETVSYVSSSGNFDIDQLFDKYDAIIDGKLPKRNVIIYIKHNTMNSQNEWKAKWSAKASKRLSRCSNYGGKTFYVNLVELDYLEKKIL